ncbi:MAG TPA: glycosyltransferase family 2 protein [Verrucomicrobiae bacterium]|nr:glycosyltransferase family 2 protein [Verrucomicrobiae bacterium]
MAAPSDTSVPLTMARVSVLVVSWNSRGFLPACLKSIEAQTHRHVETIVVDNGSTDGSADLVARDFPEATLIRNATNEGFCRANNQALKRATGVFILCLNADAILDPSFIERGLQGFTATHRVGAVSGKILRFDGVTIDSAGQRLTRARRIVDRGYGTRDDGRYDAGEEVFSVCGAAALYWRGMIDAVSESGAFFDEAFFAFCEDMDVSWRARRAGFRVWYEPSARVRHFRGGSQAGSGGLLGRFFQTARRPAAIRAHIVKNRWLMILKNDSRAALLADLPFVAAWEIGQAAWLLLASPAAIPHLWRSRHLLASAWRRRRAPAVASRPAS